MTLIKNYLEGILVVLILLSSCKQVTHKDDEIIDFETLQLDESKKVINRFDTIGEGLPIFYNMLQIHSGKVPV